MALSLYTGTLLYDLSTPLRSNFAASCHLEDAQQKESLFYGGSRTSMRLPTCQDDRLEGGGGATYQKQGGEGGSGVAYIGVSCLIPRN